MLAYPSISTRRGAPSATAPSEGWSHRRSSATPPPRRRERSSGGVRGAASSTGGALTGGGSERGWTERTDENSTHFHIKIWTTKGHRRAEGIWRRRQSDAMPGSADASGGTVSLLSVIISSINPAESKCHSFVQSFSESRSPRFKNRKLYDRIADRHC